MRYDGRFWALIYFAIIYWPITYTHYNYNHFLDVNLTEFVFSIGLKLNQTRAAAFNSY